ncbi:MAG: DUF4350 domain-containing protein [Gemmatimonadota bacterium]
MNRSRLVLRLAVAAVVAFSGLTCSLRDEGTGPGAPSVSGLQIAPKLPPNFSRFAVGLGVEQIHLTLQNQAGAVIIDTTIPFMPAAPSLTIRLPLLLSSSAESLVVALSYETQAGQQLFTGQQTIVVRAGNAAASPQIPITYVGPGSNVWYLYVTPADTVFSFGDTAFMDVQAYDSSSQVVPGVYINWQTDDPSIVVDAQGRLKVPSSTSSAVVYAQTPNGSQGAAVVYFAPGQVAVTPTVAEVLPGSSLYIGVYGGQFGSYSFSVNGIPGGDSVVGLVDPYGTYSAPGVVPSPSTVSVCASIQADTSCSQVTVGSPPSPGGDLIMLGDTYMLTDAALASQPGNRGLASQLVTFGGTGPRASGRTVIFDRGRNAACLAAGVCADSALTSMSSALTTAGYTIQRVDTAVTYRNISSGVKVIVIWNPDIYLTDRETNELKRFAREGGRVVVVADDTTSLGGSLTNALSVASDISYRLAFGSMYFTYANAGCGGPVDITGPGIQPHQSTTGITTAQIDCASELYANTNAYPLFITGQQIVGMVTKIDPTPHISYGG